MAYVILLLLFVAIGGFVLWRAGGSDDLADQPNPQALTIRVTYNKSHNEYWASCPRRGDCSHSPGPGLPYIAMARRAELAVASMNAHLDAVHGIDASVRRRVEGP